MTARPTEVLGLLRPIIAAEALAVGRTRRAAVVATVFLVSAFLAFFFALLFSVEGGFRIPGWTWWAIALWAVCGVPFLVLFFRHNRGDLDNRKLEVARGLLELLSRQETGSIDFRLDLRDYQESGRRGQTIPEQRRDWSAVPVTSWDQVWLQLENQAVVIRVTDQVRRARAERSIYRSQQTLTEEDVASTIEVACPWGSDVPPVIEGDPPPGLSLVATRAADKRLSVVLGTDAIRVVARGHSTLGHEPLPVRDGMLCPEMAQDAIRWISARCGSVVTSEPVQSRARSGRSTSVQVTEPSAMLMLGAHRTRVGACVGAGLLAEGIARAGWWPTQAVAIPREFAKLWLGSGEAAVDVVLTAAGAVALWAMVCILLSGVCVTFFSRLASEVSDQPSPPGPAGRCPLIDSAVHLLWIMMPLLALLGALAAFDGSRCSIALFICLGLAFFGLPGENLASVLLAVLLACQAMMWVLQSYETLALASPLFASSLVLLGCVACRFFRSGIPVRPAGPQVLK